VCAVRSQADLLAAVAGGADAVGVLVGTTHTAEDSVSREEARQLLARVPPYVGRYAVTHLTALDDLLGLVECLPIDALQLHDVVAPDVLRLLREAMPAVRLVKALHVTDALPDWQAYASAADALLLDSVDMTTGRIGGTGLVHDWRLSAGVVAACPIPVILAGGLTASNVGDAVRVVRPWAVNVNSGVEVHGVKDAALVAALVRGANRSC